MSVPEGTPLQAQEMGRQGKTQQAPPENEQGNSAAPVIETDTPGPEEQDASATPTPRQEKWISWDGHWQTTLAAALRNGALGPTDGDRCGDRSSPGCGHGRAQRPGPGRV